MRGDLPSPDGGDHPEFQPIFPQALETPVRKPNHNPSVSQGGESLLAAQGCAKSLLSTFRIRSKQCLLVGLNGALSLLSCSPSFSFWGCKSLSSSSFFTLILPRVPRTKPAVCAGPVAAVHPLAASAGSELERPRPAKACEGTRAGIWHCPLLCPRVARMPALTPRAPGRDEGSVKAAAIREDAKRDKHFSDSQKQTNHDALLRTICICLITSCPSPFRGHSGRFFLWHWMQVTRHTFLGALQPSTHGFPHVEPRAGCSGWTISLSAVWPWS